LVELAKKNRQPDTLDASIDGYLVGLGTQIVSERRRLGREFRDKYVGPETAASRFILAKLDA
jgi:hypothetical protein